MHSSPSTCLQAPLAVQALLTSLEKRGIMDLPNRERLRRRLGRVEVRSVAEIRRFLANGSVKPAVAAVLAKALPDDDRRIGGHPLLAHLADGGMGTVWLGDYQGRLAVIKTLKLALSEDQEYLRRFEREAKITAGLDHPNIVRCLAQGLDMDGAFMVLEYVPGGDVANLLKRSGRIAEPEAISILYQAVRGLDQAWQRSLIHRDVKPANLFIDDQGQVKVADFGLARSTSSNTSLLTMQGTTVGSPAYMSPEQIRAEALDWRADAYACGCVLHALLAGQPPFQGSISEVFAKHLTQAPPPLTSKVPGVSTASAQFVARCLAKRPEERFRTAAEMLQSLNRILVSLGGDPEATLSQSLVAGSTAALPAAQSATPPTAGAAQQDLTPTGASRSYGPDSALRQASGALQPVVDAILIDDETGAPPPEEAAAAGIEGDTLAAPHGRRRPAPPPADEPQKTLAGDADQQRFQGDWGEAVIGNRLTLTCGPDRTCVLLAQESAILGKSVGPPVDIALRDYPPSACAESCQRVSRQHLRIALLDGRLCVTDLGSANGTLVDERMLEAQEGVTLEGGEHAIAIPDSVSLRVRLLPKRTRAIAAIAGLPAGDATGPGLACGNPADAILITRPGNRPGLVYALVIRRVLIGPEIADIPIPGWEGDALEVGHWAGRWIGRLGRGLWQPVAQALGRRGSAVAGRHTDLAS